MDVLPFEHGTTIKPLIFWMIQLTGSKTDEIFKTFPDSAFKNETGGVKGMSVLIPESD